MTDPASPLQSGFPAVARDHGLTAAALTDALDRIGSAVREYPGIHDLVYEYRRAFRYDPLLDRHGDAYYLWVPDHVWPEFAERAPLSPAERDACRAVHAQLVRSVVGSDAGDDYPPDHEPLVLVA